MKVLILTDYYPPDKVGGVGEIARQLKRSYEALGHEAVVLTTGRSRSEEPGAGVLRSSPTLVLGALLNNLKALRLIRDGDFALVHLHQPSTTFFLLARLLREDFPVVVDSVQVSYLSEAREIRPYRVEGRRFAPRLREYVERFVRAPMHILLDFLAYRLSDRVTVVSRQNRAEMERTFGRWGEPASPVVIPNGVPGTRRESAPERDFRDATLEEWISDRLVLTYVGVFRIRKRLPNLLLALRGVVAEFPDTVLLLVGGGRGYESYLEDLSRRLGVREHVAFVGEVHHELVGYYLRLTDVFCLLSSYEGMPVALLEAMREGIPVVATDCYGMRDLLDGRECGVLVPVDDVDATVEALRDLIGNSERRAELGRAARRVVRDEYDWHGIAKRYLELVAAR